MSAFSFNGFGLVTLCEGDETPNGGNYSLRLEFPCHSHGYEPGSTSMRSGRGGCWGEEIHGVFRENFDRGVDWGNLIFILSENGFRECEQEGTFVRRK